MRFLTFIILLLSFTMLFSAEFEITQKIKENPAHLGLQMLDKSVKYDNNGELCALLIVRCGVKDINFSNTASKVAQIDQQGEYYITMKKGARYIVMKKTGFGSFKEHFGLVMKSGSVYEMSADEKVKQATEIPIMVTTDPSGVEIFVDNISKGRTTDGKLSCTTKEGNQNIKLVYDGFETIEENIEVKIGSQSFDFELVEAMDATISIKSNPSDAEVWIKGIKLGKTPVNAFFPAGTYTIKLEKENYETINEQITISDPTNKTYSLTDIRATLTIKTHKNATVYVNNDRGRKGGVTNLKLSPQMVNISVEMSKAETITKSILLDKKAVVTKEYYTEVQTGIVMVNVIPAGAEVLLTGDGGERYNSTGKATFRDVPVGTYELTIKADDYKTHSETFKVTSDKTTRKQIQLEEGSDVPESFVFVKGGTFQMGSKNGQSDEKPVHSVTIGENGDSRVQTGFYIGKYEVTQKEWKDVMGNNPSNWKGDNLPVERVSWYDAVEFCNKKSKKEGLQKCYSGSGKNIKCNFFANGYRLPTEAEWEYAARGGNLANGLDLRNGEKTYYKYSGSNNIKDVAWYYGNSGSQTHSVGQKQPNKLGIYDMSGNVGEWCNDWYDSSYYNSSPISNPHGANSGSYRV
ncbi:MAG: SUMF1/EgtB/PvdO family nonheme iron enzyme, partial [Candidatus Cloacimonadota bacterium]|nr:SUMF1/EgtB/PvdO family nonheme iron enzyme [Candidatus Cloacimonadota bacterium]